MAAAMGLQPARHEGPGGAEQSGAGNRGRDQERQRQEVEIEAGEGDAQAAEIGLAFGADIEEARMVGDREGEA